MNQCPANPIPKNNGLKRQQILERNKCNENLSLLVFIKEDAKKYHKWSRALRSVGFYVALSYRISHFLYRNRFGWIAALLQGITASLTFCNINRKAVIGPGLALPHPTSIYIGPHVSIGENSRFGPRIFIGSLYKYRDPSDYPVLSSGVTIAVGSTILGGITIGEGVMIGPNEAVLKNIPDFHNVMSTPPKAFLRTVNGWEQ